MKVFLFCFLRKIETYVIANDPEEYDVISKVSSHVFFLV